MKKLYFIFLTILINSCNTSKELNHTNKKEEQEHVQKEIRGGDELNTQFFEGVIQQAREDCPWLILAKVKGENFIFYPINLNEAFKMHGLRIKFTFVPSRAPQPENCGINQVVVVDDVKKI